MRITMQRAVVALVAIASVFLTLSVATAKQKVPSATLELKGGSVAAGVGVNWSNGTLTFNGKKYPVKVTGVDVVDVGAAKVNASGKVYNLTKLDDFDGTYASAGAEGTVVNGRNAVVLKNQNGVRVDIKSTTRGVKLALAAGGASMQIKK